MIYNGGSFKNILGRRRPAMPTGPVMRPTAPSMPQTIPQGGTPSQAVQPTKMRNGMTAQQRIARALMMGPSRG
jgi:hypothetical protein